MHYETEHQHFISHFIATQIITRLQGHVQQQSCVFKSLLTFHTHVARLV